MRKLSFLLLLIVLLFACKSKRATNNLLFPSNLKSQLFSIDPGKDIILRTSHASILRIKKGSFEGTAPVSIEIKEAFTPDEILLAGLTTTSNGKPLRSVGMLYFNATVNGDQVQPKIPINATIPATDIDPEMQVFKGEMNEDSTVNWVNPESIDTIKPVEIIAAGKNLFQYSCASCHRIFSDGTGPALKDVQYRGPWKNNPKNLLDFIHNPPKFMANDKYTQDLKAKYGSMMTAHPSLSEEGLQAMLAYINSVTTEESMPVINEAKDTSNKAEELGINDCWHSDTSFYSVSDTFPEYDTTSYPDVITDTSWTDTSSYDPIYRNYDKEGYDFKIDDNGWYNVDAFLKTDSKDVQNVKLIADLRMQEDVFMNVYVFVPSERIMQSTYDRKGNQYYFDFDNGTIPLPMRYRAVIFVFGSIKEKIVYGISEFTVGKEQTVPVEIKETNAEGLKYLLQSKNINGIELEAIEKKIEIIKVPCDQPEKDTVSIKTDTTLKLK